MIKNKKDNEIQRAKGMVGKIMLRYGTDSIPPSAVFVESFEDAENFEQKYYLLCRELNTGATYWLSVEHLEPFNYLRYVNLREEWDFRHALAQTERLRLKMEMRKAQAPIDIARGPASS